MKEITKAKAEVSSKADECDVLTEQLKLKVDEYETTVKQLKEETAKKVASLEEELVKSKREEGSRAD